MYDISRTMHDTRQGYINITFIDAVECFIMYSGSHGVFDMKLNLV